MNKADPSHGCASTSCAPCNLPKATATCQNGSCAVQACDAGYADCNGNAADGCETNIETDPGHCGSCNSACTSPPNTCAYCQQGACTVPGCPPGYADCNCKASDGCEVDLQADLANCGFCGHACAPGQSCVHGLCN